MLYVICATFNNAQTGNLMSLPKSIAEKIFKIHTSHKSNEAKQSFFEDAIMYEHDEYDENNEKLKKEMRDYWRSLSQGAKVTSSAKTLWTHPKLHFGSRGEIMKDDSNNLYVILTEHPKFKGRLSFNELNHQYYFDDKEIHDLDYTQLRLEICEELSLVFKKSDITDMADFVAKTNKFHPIKDYLNSLTWDQKDYMTELTSLMQVEVNDLNVNAITNWLVSAVARIMKPGCKVDSIPVFQGMTGNRKSSALKALMHDEEWFSDEPIDFGSKDAKQILLGKWFVELAELSSFNRKDNNLIKSDITHQIDEFRSPYDRKPKKYPRQFIYIGTTNDLEFLTDPTSNRRFWPLPNNGLIDVDRIKEIRDQLWAQAYSLFLSGRQWWLSREQEKEMSVIAEAYEVKDAWYEKVIEIIGDKEFVTTKEILDVLKPMNVENKDRARVIKIMQFMKWNTTSSRQNSVQAGTPVSGWKRPNIKNIVGEDLATYGEVSWI